MELDKDTNPILAKANKDYDLHVHLRTERQFLEWSIITAFYAALFYVEHYIFPRSICMKQFGQTKEEHFNCYEEFYNKVILPNNRNNRNSGAKKTSFHDGRYKLVLQFTGGTRIAECYNSLMTLRVKHNYGFGQVTQNDVERAQDAIEYIKQVCSKPKSI